MIGFGDKTILDFFDFIYSDSNVEIHKEIIECDCREVEENEIKLIENKKEND